MTDLLFQNAQRLHQAGKLAEAARLYGEILRDNPRRFEALYGLGVLHFQTGQYAEADRFMSEALNMNPRAADLQFAHGCVLQRLNRIEDALAAFDRAVESKPGYIEALMNRGAAFLALGRHAEAHRDFASVIALNPNIAGVWSNQGCVLQNLDRHDEAVSCFDKALALSPDFAEALANRGTSLAALKRFDEAAHTFEKLLRLRPDHPYGRGNLAFYRLQCCDWRNLKEDRAAIAAGVRAGKRIVQPLVDLMLSDSGSENLECARLFARDYPPSTQPLWRGERYRHDKIRLTYLSADFHAHATAFLMAGVFEHHNRARFELSAISFGPDDQSPMRSRLARAFDRFIDVRALGDREVAKEIRRLETDILVDLKGYTGDARLGVLAQRAAPLQAHYLGFPGTMAAPYVDYLITDRIVVPDEHRSFYTEKLVTLPGTYQCNDAKRPIGGETPSRAALELPEHAFVFCCFNNSSKITPEIFGVWMQLLNEVQGSVLWLLEDNAAATRNLRREAEARNVSPGRLVFAKRIDPEDHLSRQRAADLFLDTLPYGAHTTASDALWAGLPVITMLGSTFAGRVSASLLRAIGLHELVTGSLAEYRSLALKLARDSQALAAIRGKLELQRSIQPLFDTARFTRHFERGLISIYDRHSAGQPPADIAVESGAR